MRKKLGVIFLAFFLAITCSSCVPKPSAEASAISSSVVQNEPPEASYSINSNFDSRPPEQLTYKFLFMDLSVPFLERKWEWSKMALEQELTGNELLWLVRDKENGLAMAAEKEMGEITWSKKEEWSNRNDCCTVNFTDNNWVPNEQYLHNLCSTITANGEYSVTLYFRFLYQGVPMEQFLLTPNGYFNYFYYDPIQYDQNNQVGYYTAKEIQELQKQIPMNWVGPKAEQGYKEAIPAQTYLDATGIGGAYPLLVEDMAEKFGTPEVLNRFFNFMDGDGDPMKSKLSAFLCQALPGTHTMLDYASIQFDTPRDAPNELLVLSGLQHVSMLSELEGYRYEVIYDIANGVWDSKETPLTPVEKLTIINDSTERVVYGWLGEHVEQAAKYLYGDDIHIAHQGYGNKRYGYHEWIQLYSHFPGGTGGDIAFFPVLSCQDMGEQYEAEIAILYGHGGMGDFSMFTKAEDGTVEYMEWKDVVEYARTAAPRAKLTINKLENGRLAVQAFHYLGASGGAGSAETE